MILLALGAVAVASTGSGFELEWTPIDSSDLSWTSPVNWGDAAKVPCTDDTVVIPAATTVTIAAETMAVAKNMRVGGNLRIQQGSFGLRLYKNKTCDREETTATFD